MNRRHFFNLALAPVVAPLLPESTPQVAYIATRDGLFSFDGRSSAVPVADYRVRVHRNAYGWAELVCEFQV